MAGVIKINFAELESYIQEIKTQFNVLSDMKVRLAQITGEVKETWEDTACEQFEASFTDMRNEAIPQALVLLDTMQTLLETVIETYRETDQTINGMIG